MKSVQEAVTAADDALKKGEELGKTLPSPGLFLRPADALAVTATPLTPFFVAKGAGKISKVQIIPGAAVASLANVTLILNRYRSGTGAIVKSQALSGSWSLMTPVSLSGLSNTAIQADDILAITVTKTGGGFLLPAFALVVTITA